MTSAIPYIDRIYLINLGKDTQRLSSFTELANRLSFPFQRIEATNGKVDYIDPKIVDSNSYFNHANGRPSKLTHGERGLIMSHVAIWKDMLTKGYDKVLVFEDDVTTKIDRQTLDAKISQVFEATKDNPADIIYLGKCLDLCSKGIKVVDDIYQTKRPLCTHAYIITKNGVEKLMAKLPMHEPYDLFISNHIKNGYLTAYTFRESIFVQDLENFPSNLKNIGQSYECVRDFISSKIPTVIAILIGIIILLLLFKKD